MREEKDSNDVNEAGSWKAWKKNPAREEGGFYQRREEKSDKGQGHQDCLIKPQGIKLFYIYLKLYKCVYTLYTQTHKFAIKLKT